MSPIERATSEGATTNTIATNSATDIARAGTAPMLCVSIHDVAPATWPDCLRLVQAVREVADIPLTWLVVPHYHFRPERSPAMEACLDVVLERGDELALHGYSHLDTEANGGGLAKRFLRSVYTRKEGEFAALAEAEAQRRLELGLAWFAERGWKVDGFVPPAWLLGKGAWNALRASRFAYTTTFSHFHCLRDADGNPIRRSVLSPSLVYAARNRSGRLLSPRVADATARMLEKSPLVRFSLHPPDARYPELIRHTQRMLERLLAQREAVTKEACARRLVGEPALRADGVGRVEPELVIVQAAVAPADAVKPDAPDVLVDAQDAPVAVGDGNADVAGNDAMKDEASHAEAGGAEVARPEAGQTETASGEAALVEGADAEDELVKDEHIQDKQLEDTQLEDTQLEDEHLEDEQLKDKQVAKALVGDQHVADARVADVDVADAHVADAHVADTHLVDAHVAKVLVADAPVMPAPAIADAKPVNKPSKRTAAAGERRPYYASTYEREHAWHEHERDEHDRAAAIESVAMQQAGPASASGGQPVPNRPAPVDFGNRQSIVPTFVVTTGPTSRRASGRDRSRRSSADKDHKDHKDRSAPRPPSR